jgi:ferredoxin-type protein NapH
MKLLIRRRWFQSIAALLFNLQIPLFFKGLIYQGPTKGICIPVLNCYSCPAAMGACPVGALQNSLANMRANLSMARYHLGFYVIGFLGMAGALAGRIPCGWLCPFGWLQEMMYKLPFPKLKIPYFLTYLRYVILAVFVIGMPVLILDAAGYGQTWFCKLICPAGTLEAGVPLVAARSILRQQLGWLFSWKIALLFFFLLWMMASMRPFCRTICPLGTILGFFNRISFFQMSVDDELCTECGICSLKCPMDLTPWKKPNHSQCIRCLHCSNSCPYGAISHSFFTPAGGSSRKETI